MEKQQIVNEIHRSARKNFKRRSVVLKGIDDLWQADLIDLQKLHTINKGNKYILTVIDTFSKYAWCIPIKSKIKTAVKNAFELIMKTTKRRPRNLQTDLGKEFYNNEFDAYLKFMKIHHYSTYSIKKASIVERLIKTLKIKLYKYFSFIGNYKWVGKPLDDIVKAYNHTVHRTTKFKPIDVDSNNEKEVKKNILNSQSNVYKSKLNKFNIGDRVRISKYKSTFSKGYTPNWSTELFTIKHVNHTQPVTYHIEDQRKNIILGTFYEEELQKTKYPDIYLIEKVIKKKGSKLFVKWLGLSDSENSWIDIKAIV
jgi:hypothetical protein